MLLKNKFKIIPLFVSCIISFLMPFLICSFSQDAAYESLSNLIADIGISYSKTKSANINIFLNENNPDFKTVSKLVNECRTYSINKTAQELYSFRATYNCGDDVIITFDDFDEHIAILPHTTSSIHKNSKNENVFDWFEIKVKNEYNSSFDYSQSNSFVLITESLAKNILERDGIEYSLSNAQYLLDTPHFITGKYIIEENEIPIKFQIANIIIENEGNDSFLKNTIGEYITMYLYQNSLPNFRGISVNMDFGSSISENKRFLKTLKDMYSFDEYEYQISRNNIIDMNESVEDMIEQFESKYKHFDSHNYLNDTLAISLSIFFQIVFFIPVLVNVIKTKKVSRICFLIIFASFFLVYYFFFFCNKFGYNIFFTTTSTAVSFINCLVFMFLMLYLRKRYSHYILKLGVIYKEINI